MAAEGHQREAVALARAREVGKHALGHGQARGGFTRPGEVVQAHGERGVEQHHNVAAFGRGGDPCAFALRLRECQHESQQRQRAQHRRKPGLAARRRRQQQAVQIGVQKLARWRRLAQMRAPRRQQRQDRQRQQR